MGERSRSAQTAESSSGHQSKRIRLDLGRVTGPHTVRPGKELTPGVPNEGLTARSSAEKVRSNSPIAFAAPQIQTRQPTLQHMPANTALPESVNGPANLPSVSAPMSGDSEYFESQPTLVFDYGIDTQKETGSIDTQAQSREVQTDLAGPADRLVTPEPSSGTLVISKHGGSRYFGHTAASEWLKDVSSHNTCLDMSLDLGHSNLMISARSPRGRRQSKSPPFPLTFSSIAR